MHLRLYLGSYVVSRHEKSFGPICIQSFFQPARRPSREARAKAGHVPQSSGPNSGVDSLGSSALVPRRNQPVGLSGSYPGPCLAPVSGRQWLRPVAGRLPNAPCSEPADGGSLGGGASGRAGGTPPRIYLLHYERTRRRATPYFWQRRQMC